MDEESRRDLSKITYAELLAEIKNLEGLLSLYRKGDPSIPQDFNYKQAIFTLRYCRSRQNSWKKSERNI